MASKAISVREDLVEHAERHVASGRFDSVTEVISAGLAALDREEAAFNDMLRAKIQEALDDPRPSMSADEAFADIRRRIRAGSTG